VRCASLAAAAAVVVVHIFPDDDDDDDDVTPKQPKPLRSSHKEEEDKEDKEIARRHAVEKLKEEEDKEDLLPKREAFASFREMNIFCAFSQSVLFSLAFVGFTTEGKIRFSSSSEVLKNAYEFRALAGHTHTREREKRYTNESRGGYRGGGG
jgi:hypothetical protein